MSRLDQAVSWIIILLGLRAWLVAARVFPLGAEQWSTGFWFLSTGLLFLICGALGLLRARQTATAPGLRRLAVAASVGLAGLVVTAGILGGETVPSVVAGILLVAAAGFAGRSGASAGA
jgi:hypothetical protein